MPDSAPRRRARQLPPEERQRQLLDVAIQVFAEKGLDAAKHADIAKAAEVSVPTTFKYFPTRDDLIAAVLERTSQFILDELARPFMTPRSFDERMAKSGKALLEAARHHPDYMKVWTMWSSHYGEPYRSSYIRFEEDYLQYVARIIAGPDVVQPDRATREKARILMGLANFLTQQNLRGDNEERLERYVQNVTRTMRIWIND